MSNFLNKLEEATNKFTFAHVKAGLLVSGQECLMFKRQLSDQADEVYGVFAGNSTFNSSPKTTYEQSSIYDEVYNNPPETEFQTIDLTNGIFNPTPIDTNVRYKGEGVPLKVLFNNYQWRLINKFDLGYIEEAGYAYTITDSDLNEGDILSINRSDSKQIRFIVVGLEVVGNQTTIFHRFKLSSLGD